MHLRDDTMDQPRSQGNGLSRPQATSQPVSSIGEDRAQVRFLATTFSILGSSWQRTLWRALWVGCSLCVILYSIAVLTHVARMGSIGVRCMFGTKVEEEVLADYDWRGGRPRIGDSLVSIGPFVIRDGSYSDYIKTLRGLSSQVGDTIEVHWREENTERNRSALVKVQYPPTWTYFRSCVWFLQELLIFAIGARVLWKRPDDKSAQLFFAVCIFTVGAFMGGYHWTEIVTEPLLIYPFALFAVFVPVVNLHFYLVFPRANPILENHRAVVIGGLYGIPAAYLAALWGSMYACRWSALNHDYSQTAAAFQFLRGLALGYIGLAAFLFSLCILCLTTSYRRAATRAERNQVRWILLASLISSVLIAYLLAHAYEDPATLGRGNTAWPMFGVSLLFTMAHAFSITRYKLMQVEEIINRSAVYFAFSLTAGLIYSGVLLVSGKLIGDQLFSTHSTSRGAVAAALSVIVVLILSEVVRARFQRVIDRQFFREKYKFDRAMQKMRLAVGSLIDRTTLGRRLLEAAAEVLRLEWGALYLGDVPGRPLQLVASHGPAPDERSLAADNPLAVRLRQTHAVRLSHALALNGASDPATDAMIALGGEAATSLGDDGNVSGLLILGPKRSGMPYEDEEMAFLAALSSVATLVLHSADIQQTLEGLNRDLRDKVEKITEQQRRILILQDQLRDRAEREREGSGAPPERRPTELAREASGEGETGPFASIRGSSAAVRRMIGMARKVAVTPSAVLIRGESGTGKELLAAAIHQTSPRAGRPFVKLHCAALSQSLLESELFGHVKSAFTGADRDRVGRFEQANGGTLFLDEIGDINLEVQTKLLRVLQEMSFERVGSSQPITVDVRILAATHQDLEALIRAGRFREDLYYRLNVICLHAPALRERREDIFELAVYFLNLHAQRTDKLVTHLDPEAVEALVAYDWPGNIRELENVLERAVVLADGPGVMLEDLPRELRQPVRRRLRPRLPATVAPGTGVAHVAGEIGPPVAAVRSTLARGPVPDSEWGAAESEQPGGDDWNSEFAAYERQRLIDALNEAQGNKSVAARLLGMPRSTFFSKVKKYGIV
jgi:transcriptional regulator with GAF, ATPase, and Fis domain